MRDFLGDDDPPLPTTSQSLPSSGLGSDSQTPARPPNPQTLALHAQIHTSLSSLLAQTSQTLAADTQRLQAVQSDLLAGEPSIQDEMARLRAVRDVCKAVGEQTRAWNESVEGKIREVKARGEPEVDEIVCSTAVVYNQ